MQLRAALKTGLEILLKHQVPSAQLAAELLLMHVARLRPRLSAHERRDGASAPAAAEQFFSLVGERTTGKPMQYITGHQEFWGLDFEVTPDVLIPRPETEHVVERVLELARRSGFTKDSRLRIVDVGTGSGCIALALAAEFPRAILFGADISRAALVVASRNAVRLGMPERVKFLEGDLLARFLDRDFLAQLRFRGFKPALCRQGANQQVQREVREFEPLIAWGNLERGDEIYARLFPQALRVLKPGGYVVVEIGYNMRDQVLALLGREWTDIEVMPDLAGIPRVVSARKSA